MEQAKAEQEKRVAMEEQRRTMLVAILSPEARSRRESGFIAALVACSSPAVLIQARNATLGTGCTRRLLPIARCRRVS
jgi:hypothetical protein